MAIAITRQDESAADLRRMARLCRNVAQFRRLLAIASVMDGRSRTDAATTAGMDRQALRDWLHRFNAEGPSGLVDKPRSCRPPRLSEEQLKDLDAVVGIVGWTASAPSGQPESGWRRTPSGADSMSVRTIGLDLAKQVFQVHGVDDAGRPVLKKRLRRAEVRGFFAGLAPCVVGMGACASSQCWARELAAVGHEVRLMPLSYVKPYVKRQKNDAADAEAICEAVTRPNMRFVPIKLEDQQAVLMLHRTRDLLIRQRTALTNALRAHLAELGIVARHG